MCNIEGKRDNVLQPSLFRAGSSAISSTRIYVHTVRLKCCAIIVKLCKERKRDASFVKLLLRDAITDMITD